MSTAVVLLSLSGALIVIGSLLREREVGDDGSIGRSPFAHLITVALTVTTIGAAIATITRLVELAVS